MIRTILVACLVSICCFISGGVETAVTTQSPQLQTNATKEAITQSPQLKTNATKVAITQSPQLKTNVTKEAITQSPQLQTNVTKAATTQLPQLQTDVTKRATTKLPQPQTNVTKATTIKLPQPQTNATKAATTKLSQPQTNVTKAIHADGITSNIIYTKVSSSPLGNLNNANTSKTFWNLFGALNNTNITKVIGSLFENLNKTNISKDLENLFAAFDNKNVTNALGNATEALSKLFGDGNGMAGVAKVMESLLGNGNTMAGISKAIGELLGNGNGIAGIAGTIEKIFGNGKGMAGIDQTIGKLLENGNGMEGLAKAINGLFGVANGSNIAKTIEGLLGSVNSSGTGKTSSLGSLQVNPVIGSLTKLLPFVFEFLTSGFKALEEKNVSKACMADLYMWKDGLQLYQGWAWKLIDAGFKIPSNLAGFNIMSMGDMGECVGIHAKSVSKYTQQMQEFDGKYCRMLIPLMLPQVGRQTVILGACASSHCSNNDVKIIVDSAIGAIVPKIPIEATVSCIEDKTLDSKSIAVICFLAILGSIVVASTIYDIIAVQLKSRDDELNSYSLNNETIQMTNVHANGAYVVSEVENGPLPVKKNLENSSINGVMHNADLSSTKPRSQLQGRLVKAVLAFSAYSNSRKLLATKQASGSLSAINGIRFLSMAWVILGHTYYFGMNYTSNKFDFGKTKLNQYLFFAIINATPSVDSFFALSGCLVAYLTLREIKKVGGVKKLNWAMFYFHRFWRLTPPYMLIILVGTILYRYIGNGALQTGEDSMFMHNCRKTWWTNLLYVNNFVKTDEMCMGWSWYLANDMQMYVLSPLILIPFFYNKIFGWIVSAIFLISTIVTTSVIAHGHEYPVQSFSQYAPTKPDKHYEELMYIPVYTRIGPYIVGLITGYILYKCKCKCKIPKWVNFCCWFMCLLVCTLIIYGPYTYEDNHIMSTNESTAFYALFRTGWGMAVCWVIFACATGNGGFVNDVLSWSPYVPLGRLTYCAYLLHPLIMLKYYENRMQPLYFTDYDTVYYFLGNLVLSYGAAFVTSLFFESPMMGLEKAIFNK